MSAPVNHQAAEDSPQLRSYYHNRRLFYWNVLWVICGSGAAGLGISTAQSLMPLHMSRIGLDARQISTIMSLNGFIGIPVVLYISYLSDHWQGKWGRRLPFLAMSLPFTVTMMAVFPAASSFVSCLLIYTVFTFFVSIKSDTYPFLIYDISRQKFWGRVYGISGLVSYVFVWIGQSELMPLTDSRGEYFVFRIGAVIVAVATALTLLFLREPPVRSPERPRANPLPVIWAALRIGFVQPANLLLFAAFALACGVTLISFYVPLQAQANLGLSAGQVGTQILQYGTLVTVALSYLMGWTIDKLGPVRSMTIGYAICLAACFTGLHPHSVLALRWAYVLSMTGSTLVYMAASIFVIEAVPREDVATFCACNGAVNLFIRSLLMVLTGWLIAHFFRDNYGTAFIVGTAITTLGLPLFFLLARRRHTAAQQAIAAMAASGEPSAADSQSLQLIAAATASHTETNAQ